MSTHYRQHYPQKSVVLFDCLAIFIILAACFRLFLGAHGIVDPDEGRYSEVARELLRSGDWITPQIEGVPFLDKPILFYWLQALSMHWFGISALSIRIFPALFGTLSCVFVYLGGHYCVNRRAGLLSAAILATMPLYFGIGHFANMDIEVASLMTGATVCFVIAMTYAPSKSRRGWCYSAYTLSALAFLTKGMIGLVFPMLAIGFWVLFTNRWFELKKAYLISGILLYAIITVPWFALAQYHNPQFLYYFFIDQQVFRFVSTDFNSQRPIWYYLYLTGAGMLPWLFFLPQALKQQWQTPSIPNRLNRLFCFWPFIILVFFSIPASKLPGYITPIFPPLALLIGCYLSQTWAKTPSKGFTIGAILFALLMAIIAAASLVWSFWLPEAIPHQTTFITRSGWLFFIGFIGFFATLLALWQNKKIIVFSVIVILMMATQWLALSLAHYLPINTVRPLVQQIQHRIKPNDEVVLYHVFFQGIPLYLDRKVTVVNHWAAAGNLTDDSWRRMLALGLEARPQAHQWLIENNVFWQRWCHNKHPIWVITDHNHIQAFEAHPHCPYTIEAVSGKRVALLRS